MMVINVSDVVFCVLFDEIFIESVGQEMVENFQFFNFPVKSWKDERI